MDRAFCRPHAYTFNEQSKMATALTPQTDVTSVKNHVTDGEPETAVSASLQKIKSITNKKIKTKFYFIKSQTSDSFVNHFNGYFAYLKTWTFPLTPSRTGYTVKTYQKLAVDVLFKTFTNGLYG